MILKRNPRILLSLLVLTFTFSCKTVVNLPATFVMEHKEESMPVWVHGNEKSEYIILAVHGGPGSNVLDLETSMVELAFEK